MSTKLFLTASLSLGLISSCNFANNTDTLTETTATKLVLTEKIITYGEKKSSNLQETNPFSEKTILPGKTLDEVGAILASSYYSPQVQDPELSFVKEEVLAIDLSSHNPLQIVDDFVHEFLDWIFGYSDCNPSEG